MAKKSTTKNTPVEPIPQTAIIVSNTSPETTLAIPLTTENIVDAAAYERQQDLERRIAVIRDTLTELQADHEAKSVALTKAGQEIFNVRVKELCLDEFPEVVAMIDAGWLSWPTATDFGFNYIQHLRTDRTADLPLQVTLNKGKQSHKSDKEGVERKRIKLHLIASFSLQMSVKDVIKLAHQLQPLYEAATEVFTAIKQAEAQHQLLLTEAGKQAEFKRHFMAQLTRGALRGAGVQGTAYSELISRVVDAASAQLDQKLLTVVSKSK